MMIRAKTLLMSFWLGIAIGLATSPIVVADDTEIYTRQLPDINDVRPEDARPNILFIFDRSGSMNWVDYGPDGTPLYGGQKRIERLKEAFLALMDEIQDVNIGFGSFTGNGKRGAAINFPITNVDLPVSDVDGEEDLPSQETNRINSAENDAEEDSTGKVTLISENLEMTRYSAAEEKVVNPYITSGNQNVIREIIATSPTSATKFVGRTYLGDTTSIARYLGANANGEGLLALRFPDLNIPQNANIVTATVKFTSVELSNTALTIDVHGAAQIKAPVPNVDANGVAVTSGYKTYALTQGANAWTSKTSARVVWDVPAWAKEEQSANTTVDVTSIVQEMVNDYWAGDGKDVLGLTFESRLKDGSSRRFHSLTTGKNASKRPQLSITYTEPGSDAEQQTVGLRFEDVRVLQGALIRSATLEFTSGASVDEDATLTIAGEKTPDSSQFSDADYNLSSRLKTNTTVEWQPTAWTEDSVYNTSNITDIVQEIVNQKDWCGGNAMAFFVSSENNPLRNARSYDHVEDDTAPVLKIDYSVQNAPQTACIKNTYVTSVSGTVNDAEETENDKAIFITSPVLEMTTDESAKRIIALRFQELPLFQGTKINSAALAFTSAASDPDNTAPANLKITAEKTGDAEAFGELDTVTGDIKSPGVGNISSRPKTSSSATWNITTPWISGNRYATPEDVNDQLKDVIQEVVNQSSWQPYNDLAIFIEGTGLREVQATDMNNPDSTVSLKLEILGALASGSGQVFTTVRERIKELANEMLVGGATPLVDAIYEAGQYYTGKTVDVGSSRYTSGENRRDVFKSNQVSHPGTWIGASLDSPTGCDKATTWDTVCIDQKIEGTATYTPPPTPSCAKNYIVFLTDGSANGTDSKARVRTAIDGNCATSYKTAESGLAGQPFKFTYADKYTSDSNGNYVNDSKNKTKTDSDEECGTDMVKYLYEKHGIITHTIGFSLGNYYSETANPSVSSGWVKNEQRTDQNKRAEAYMREWAASGGGNFYEATSASELLTAFRSVITSAKIESAAFAAPTVSVSAFNNQLFHNNEIYFALFKPDFTPRWHGNIKKFKLCGVDGSCSNAGTLVDAKGKVAADADTGRIDDNAISYWSSETDGPTVTKGGAGERLQRRSWSSRGVFTLTDPDVDTSPGADRNIQIVTEIDTQNPSGNYIHPKNEAVTKKLLLSGGEELEASVTEEDIENSMSDEERTQLLDWIRGRDVLDEDTDGSTDDSRWMLGDALHSSPGAITYGGTEANPDVRLYYGTNDGLIRMVDARDNSGNEGWAFLPPEMLPIQPTLMKNETIGRRLYGIDGSPRFWIRDLDTAGEISGNDFVKMYIGMRRGGRNYYALDVTDPNQPTLMWTLKGGNETNEFNFLGQTWSDMRVTAISWGGQPRTVLFFGGGYDLSADKLEGGADGSMKTTDGDPVGNAVYMLDAETGDLLWWASSTDNLRANLRMRDMVYAVPSQILLYDHDSDKLTDRLYFGDMGGQMWRIDFDFSQTNSAAGGNYAGAIIGSIGLAARGDSRADERRFFYPPEVIRSTCFGEEYFTVAVTSGTRPTPLDNRVRDRFFAFKDTTITEKLYELANAQPGQVTTGVDTVKNFESDMYNVTPYVSYESAEQQQEVEGSIQDKLGWYIDLSEDGTWVGEKGMASPVMLEDVLFYTTYLPIIEVSEPKEGECVGSANDGSSRLYAVNICNGTAGYDFKNDKPVENPTPDENGLSPESRYESLGTGLVSDIAPLYLDDNTKRLSSNFLPQTEADLFPRLPELIFWRQN